MRVSRNPPLPSPPALRPDDGCTERNSHPQPVQSTDFLLNVLPSRNWCIIEVRERCPHLIRGSAAITPYPRLVGERNAESVAGPPLIKSGRKSRRMTHFLTVTISPLTFVVRTSR